MFAVAGPAHATGHYGQYYDYVYKVSIGGSGDNYLYINVPGNFSTSHGCSKPFYARSLYPLSDERTKAWLQQATASLLSRTPVYVETNGCTDYGYPIIDQLVLGRE